jgi:hypothetical protein
MSYNITHIFKGYRIVRKRIDGKIQAIPQMPKLTLTKNLLKLFEKSTILTTLQYNIVKEQLEKCTEKTSPEYIARLCAILEKPITEKLEAKK